MITLKAAAVIDGPTEKVTVTHWHSFTLNTWEPLYFNFNCRNNRPGSAFDTTAFQSDKPCIYSFPRVPLPLPDSNGFIGISETDNVQFSPEDKIAKNYITHCLSQPLYVGQAYTLSFYLGFGASVSTRCPQGYPTKSQSHYGIAIFGRQDCPGYPIISDPSLSAGCLTNNTGWVQLGTITLQGENEWVTGAIQFTPQTKHRYRG
jgi:hypothetical protein